MSARPRAGWIATPLLAIAAGASVAGLTGLVFMDGWLRGPLVGLAVAAVAVAIGRATLRSRALPTLIGALAGAWALIVALVPAGDSRAWLPTPGVVAEAGRMLVDAYRYAQDTVAPAAVPATLALAIGAGLVVIFLTAEALAVGAGLAASSGFVLILPWLPALATQRDLSLGLLAVALACWLAVLALQRRGEARAPQVRGARDALVRAGATSAIIALAIGTATLVGPLVQGAPGWGALPRFEAPASLQGPIRLDLDIDLRDSLGARSQAPVLTYVSPAGRLQVVRLYSRTTFNGTRWVDHPVDTGDLPAATDLLWPEPDAGPAFGTFSPVTFDLFRSGGDRAALPAVPRTAPSGSSWLYDAENDELYPESGGTAGLVYTVQAALDFHTEDSLLAAETGIAAGGDAAVGPAYLDLAPSIDVDAIRALALDVTGTATTRYAQAVALQEYLKSAEFDYTEDVSPEGDDSVSVFLEDKRGYCIHFASAMAVMARTLGIPARVSVGYLGGSPTGGDRPTYLVRASDAHMWPELYFPGHGWVRFEPTPAAHTGPRPDYAPLPTASASPAPSESALVPTAAASTPAASPGATDAAGAGAGSDAGTGVPWLAVLLTALGLGGAGALTVWLIRRHRATLDPERAWAQLTRRAGVELAGPPSLTPHETAARIMEAVPLASEAVAALERLRDAVEDQRYAPHGSAATASDLADWLDAVRPELTGAPTREGLTMRDRHRGVPVRARGRPAPDGARSAPPCGS